MSKINMQEIERAEDQRCRAIEKLAKKKGIDFREAEALHMNDTRNRAIETLSRSLNMDWDVAEEYHDALVSVTKDMIVNDALLTTVLKKIG